MDGYKYEYIKIDNYVQEARKKGNTTVLGEKKYQSTDIVINSYDHINWGWYGQNNGYFWSGVFDTTKGSFDNPYNDNQYNFEYSIKYFVVK